MSINRRLKRCATWRLYMPGPEKHRRGRKRAMGSVWFWKTPIGNLDCSTNAQFHVAMASEFSAGPEEAHQKSESL